MVYSPMPGESMINKTFIFSDIHGNLEALTKTIASIDEGIFNESHKIFLGDYIDFGPWPNETICLLRTFDNAVFILGNHDLFILDETDVVAKRYFGDSKLVEHVRWTREQIDDDNIKWLKSLNSEEKVTIGGKSALCFHGDYKNPEKGLSENGIKMIEEDIIMCGHIHRPYINNVGRKIAINPGSIGESLDKDNRASYLIIEENKNELDFKNIRVEYNINNVENEMRKKNMPMRELIFKGIKEAYVNK
jgi:putative phosphoesterase